MERTALRLATVATLLNGGAPPYPTVAGEFVYDSLIDNIPDTKLPKPVIVVRTDQDATAFEGNSFSGRIIRLLVEISMVTGAIDLVGGVEVKRLNWPQTDAALELMLDGLEWQVMNTLRASTATRGWPGWFRDFGYGNHARLTSTPRYTTPDKGQIKLATRTLEFQVKAYSECIGTPVHEGAPEPEDFLPPRLVAVVSQIIQNASGAFKTSVEQHWAKVLAHLQTPRPTAPALHRVWMNMPQYETDVDMPIEQTIHVEAAPLTGDDPELGTPNPTIGG